ncbi:MAG: 50S ribosomal protein L13 [Pseudomonadota bacterium]
MTRQTLVPKTYSAKKGEVSQQWYLVDAQGLALGRLASLLAGRLRGKHKPHFTPHIDTGDHMIVINAEKVRLTGQKRDKPVYRHTGYPGGIRSRTMGEILDGDHPQRVIEKAVTRMVSKGPLGRQVLRKLHVYAGDSHPHSGQNPQILDVAAMNPKNKRAS